MTNNTAAAIFHFHRPSPVQVKSRRGKSTPLYLAGLTFETSNGTIWGTPTELWTQTAYTVWANNTGGSAVAYLNITVVDEVPTIALLTRRI